MMYHGDRTLQITLDFLRHELQMELSDGTGTVLKLEPQTVADFYARTMAALRGLGINVKIWPMPVEIPEPIRFTEDVIHRSYDPAYAHAFWSALVTMMPVFESFRCGFLGKCSPVHFFWGSFDLAVTRFSGKRNPTPPDADRMTQEAYSHEVISHGFWPGAAWQDAAFYAYAAPAPEGLAEARVEPAEAYYTKRDGLFILPYDVVRRANDPEATLAAFPQHDL